MASLLYTAELDLAEEDVRPFLDWYAYRHVPDLFPLGFESCACYRTEGGDMNLFDIYEIPGHEVFAHPGYRRMNERDRYAAPILAKRRAKAHTLYTQLPLGPAGDGLLDADRITVARFDTGEAPEALAARLAASGIVGAGRGRLGCRTADHPVYTTHRPRFMVVIEAPGEAPGEAPAADPEALAAAIGSDASRLDTFSARRIYPWPTAA